MFSKRSNSWFCGKYYIMMLVANFVSMSSSNVTSVLPSQRQANYRHLLCTYRRKRWSSPLWFSVNGSQHDWWDRLHLASPSSTSNFTSWVCSCTLAMWWGRSKESLRKKLAMHKPPEHIPPVLPMFQRLSREKGDMNSFGSLHLLLSCSHRAAGMPALRPLNGCTLSHVTTVPPRK